MHGLAPLPLSGFINFKSDTNVATGGAAGGDCSIPLRKTAFSLFLQAITSVEFRTTIH